MLLKPSYISGLALNDLTRWRTLNEATLEMHKAKTPGAIIHVLAKNLNKIGFSIIVGELDPPMTELKLKFASLFDHEQGIDPIRSQELLSLGGHILSLSSLRVSRSAIQQGTVEFVTLNLQVLHDALGPLIQRILDGLLLSNELVLSAKDALSAIVAPVQGRGEGAKNYLTLITSTHISPDDLPLITAFTDLTALMMENKTLRRETKTQQKNVETLREVSKIISSNLDPHQVLTSILEQLATVIAYDSAAIMLEHQGHLRLEAGRGIDREGLVPEIIVPVEASPLYQEMKRGREPIIINDIRNDLRFKFWAGTNPIRSWIGVPLILHDKVIGQISVDSFKKHSFKKADADLAFAFAQHMVTAIHNARLFDKVSKTADELRALLDGARDVSSSLNTERIIYLMANRLKELMQATVMVFLLEPNNQIGDPVIYLETYLDQLTESTARLGKHIARQAMADKNGLIVNYPEAKKLKMTTADRLPLALMAVPFIVQDKAIGAVILSRDDEPIFTQMDLDLLTRFALQTGIAIDNSRLYAQLERRLERENLINKFTRRMSRKLSLARLAQDVMFTAQHLSGADLAGLVLVDPLNGQMYLGYVQNSMGLNLQAQSTQCPAMAALAMEQQRIVLTDDYNQESYAGSKWVEEKVQGAIAIPITTGDRVVGALGIFKVKGAFIYSDELLNMLEYLGWQASVAIDQAFLFQQLNEYAYTLEEKVEERTAEIQKQKEQTDAILESAADAIFITSAEGIIEYANPAFTDLTGYSAEEAVEQPFSMLISEQTPKQKIDQLWTTILAGKVWQGDIKNKRKDGSDYDAALTMAPIFDSDARVDKFVAIQRDMSKKIELDKLKTEFLVTASHELRTPLTTIIGYTELLLNRQFSSSEINHYLKYIYDQSKNLSNLVSDLLDVSRMEAGTAFIVAPERIDPGPIFNQVVGYWQETSPKHDIRLTQPESWPDIEADPDRLKQVLNNLLSNAVKYSPGGGIVVIEVKKNLSNLRVSIQDQGIGMTRDEQQHLFEKFWRADAGSVAVEGTGLGMVIVKHIIESHGGQIWVSSRKGEGTTVNFTWPLFNAAATVLIIEDEPSVLEIEESLLRMEGYHVMAADTGRKGLDLAVSEHPDLIILDLMLPELGGEEILYKLKERPTTQNIPVVVVSAKSGLTNIEQAFALGATDFLTKPFDFDEFLGRIKIALLSKPT